MYICVHLFIYNGSVCVREFRDKSGKVSPLPLSGPLPFIPITEESPGEEEEPAGSERAGSSQRNEGGVGVCLCDFGVLHDVKVGVDGRYLCKTKAVLESLHSGRVNLRATSLNLNEEFKCKSRQLHIL